MSIKQFMNTHFKHFNAASIVDASKGYEMALANGNKMMITLAGAMSTAEIGISLAQMIRQDKVHIISCTGANLEEDIMNLVAHDFYKRIPNYRDLTPHQEEELLNQGLNRVTDTCIPEEEAFRRIQTHIFEIWQQAHSDSVRKFPHEFMYDLLISGSMEKYYQINPENSWVLAAAEKGSPILVPGWEDSTLGNIFTSYCIKGDLSTSTMKSGIEYMQWFANWYINNSQNGIGFFQVGGGIAGDFPICVVPMLHQDLEMDDVPLWTYFCQISDSTTSYGSYSGAVPNEKITWGKLGANTPKFIVESDASIVAPLVFGWILDL